ncbi:unnamed protein product [Cuscuta campestris]|uniref:Fucosyltransferase n=1 Tax=Cuscuta campestris TaxID=132261 RepID=A0A484LP82_9ASTE|nr:unnamed protein product [Cuscuta campestris]
MASLIPTQRLPKVEDGPVPGPAPIGSPSYPNTPKKRWFGFLPLFVALVVLGEIAFLGRLDMAKNVDMVNSWADSFYQFTASSWPSAGDHITSLGGDEVRFAAELPESVSGLESCEEWLEREDTVAYSRDFEKDPILVNGGHQEWKFCAVGCKFMPSTGRKPDAAFGSPGSAETAGVHRSMESEEYYSENNIGLARRRGYDVVMTTSLSSDVPVGYFSWAEYDIMAPVQPKTQKALAAAFISNCGARNFRLQALEALEKEKVTIDSYGSCHRNKNGDVKKVDTLRHYKFSLAFENSNVEDYVTEKFFQSLVAGSVPVVVGAPNIEDYAPCSSCLLHIKKLEDVESVAKTMKHLAENPSAYNQSLRWKFEGPSDSFKALVDMAAVHSSCRLCIHLATRIQEREEKKSTAFAKRPCKCSGGSQTVYHIYVRERGRFNMESVFLRSSDLTLEALRAAVLEKFKSRKHVPIWKEERPAVLRGGDELRVYRVYPVGLTQREALYSFRFNGDSEFRKHIESNPCAKFEVIFV